MTGLSGARWPDFDVFVGSRWPLYFLGPLVSLISSPLSSDVWVRGLSLWAGNHRAFQPELRAAWDVPYAGLNVPAARSVVADLMIWFRHSS